MSVFDGKTGGGLVNLRKTFELRFDKGQASIKGSSKNGMTDQNTIQLHALKLSCSNCSLRELCLPVGLNREEMSQLDAVIRQSRRIKRGEYLFRSGESFKSLFAIRTGFFSHRFSDVWRTDGARRHFVQYPRLRCHCAGRQ
jgi:hypothetical protein